MKIVLATNNPGKVEEYNEILAPLGISVLTPKDLGVASDPEETGADYRQNSFIKARALQKLIHLPVIADDSGIEIEAMGNRPGLNTARFAKENGGFPAVFSVIFDTLKDEANRKAAFHCCICYLESEESEPRYFEGVCPGRILTEVHGSHGFGYDPIFHADEPDCDFGLASDEIKNTYSHRGKALKKLLDYLNNK